MDPVAIKTKGIELMNKEKYEDAYTTFTEAINNLPNTEEVAILKMTCISNRASCCIFLNKLKEANENADELINLYQKLRPDEMQKQMTTEAIQKDNLTFPLSLAYLTRGRVQEVQGNLKDALQEYSLANSLVPGGEGQIGIERVLSYLGVGKIDTSDPDLRPFSIFVFYILNEFNTLQALTNLLEFCERNPFSEDFVSKVNTKGSSRILYAVIQLHKDNEMIVTGVIHCLKSLSQRNIFDVWSGLHVLSSVAFHWKENPLIIGDFLSFLRCAPSDWYLKIASLKMNPFLVDCIKMDLKPEEIDAGFFVIYMLTSGLEMITEIVSFGIIDLMLEKKTRSGILLLGKVYSLKDICFQGFRDGATEWAFASLTQDPEDVDLISAAMIVIAQALVHVYDDDLTDDEKSIIDQIAKRVLDSFFSLILKYKNVPEIASNGFASLTFATHLYPKPSVENKGISLASVLLALQINLPEIVQNYIAFLFEVAHSGFVEEIKANKGVLPTVLKAMEIHQEHEKIYCLSVCLLYLCDHPEKTTYLTKAVVKYPHSDLLSKHLAEWNK